MSAVERYRVNSQEMLWEGSAVTSKLETPQSVWFFWLIEFQNAQECRVNMNYILLTTSELLSVSVWDAPESYSPLKQDTQKSFLFDLFCFWIEKNCTNPVQYREFVGVEWSNALNSPATYNR